MNIKRAQQKLSNLNKIKKIKKKKKNGTSGSRGIVSKDPIYMQLESRRKERDWV